MSMRDFDGARRLITALSLSAVKEWASLAAKWFSYEIGADSGQFKEMEMVMARPGSHHAWGKRPILIVGGPAQ